MLKNETDILYDEVVIMKKAKWKNRSEYHDYLFTECSSCGFRVESYKAVKTGRSSAEYTDSIYKYCPICGAKMTV